MVSVHDEWEVQSGNRVPARIELVGSFLGSPLSHDRCQQQGRWKVHRWSPHIFQAVSQVGVTPRIDSIIATP